MRAALLVLYAGAAWACAPEPYPSVHFAWGGPGFGPPSRPVTPDDWEPACGRFGRWEYEEADWREAEKRSEQREAVLQEARALIGKGQYRRAAAVLRKHLAEGGERTSEVRDRLAALQVEVPEVDHRLRKLFLLAIDFEEDAQPTAAQGLLQRVYAEARSEALRSFALYRLASLEYEWEHFVYAGALYDRLAVELPQSPRRELALLMAARSWLRSPPQGGRWWGEWDDTPLPSESAVRRGHAALKRLLRDYPKSRFRLDALGWLGRCEYVRKQYAKALPFYLRQYAEAENADQGWSAVRSLDFTFRRMTADEARQFAATLKESPNLVLPYLDYRLYHCHDSDEEAGALAGIAESALEQGVPLPSAVPAVLAEIQFDRRRYVDCQRWARRALKAAAGEGARQDLALYLLGAVAYRLERPAEALTHLESLLVRFPESYLSQSAREMLASLYEDRGALGTALQYYFQLEYDADVAFMLDAKMTPAEIEAFLAAHPQHEERDLLLYSLGMRYLRLDEFDRAEVAFRRVPPLKLVSLATNNESPTYGPEPARERTSHDLYNPLWTVRDLRELHAAIDAAPTANEKAEAMYALASYYYHRRHLLLYNEALWHHTRAYNFGFWWPEEPSSEDEEAARDHHYQHECVNRAREICLDLVEHYPDSPVAAKALYRAACATRRLAAMNPWWRSEGDRRDFWGQSSALMRRVCEDYPKDPLAEVARKYAGVFEEEASRGW